MNYQRKYKTHENSFISFNLRFILKHDFYYEMTNL